MKQQYNVEVGDILPLALTLVVAGMGIAFGLDVLNDTRTDFVDNTINCNAVNKTNCPASWNATTDTIAGVAKFADKLALIATVIVASIVIALLVRFLFVR